MNYRIPELLAPAGSPETLMAGLDAGADAFYCGAPGFNARKRAKNFTLDELEGATALVHSQKKKIYIALNTLVYDKELSYVIDLLVFLDRIGVDAIIVQDIGLINLVSLHFPRLAIHASTQAFAHNSAQCDFLKNLGVKRIVLPREMSLDEIRFVSEKIPVEYELFIHGAMCFSFSGMCLASSYKYNASGNRGECRQICRHEFDKEQNGKSGFYPCSMKDLDSTAILREILALEPSSLKIEGRLKNSDYVFKTVSQYRNILDKYANNGTIDVLSKLSGQRKCSTGYYTDNNYERLVANDAPGVTGEKIGVAEISKKGMAVLAVDRKIQKGARIRLCDKKGRVINEGTLLDFSTKASGSVYYISWKIAEAEPVNQKLDVLLTGTTNPRDHLRVFRHALSERKNFVVGIGISWINGALNCIAILPDFSNRSFETLFPVNLEDSRSNPYGTELSDKLEALFLESAAHKFAVESVEVEMPAGKFAPPSILKNIKRTFFENLDSWLSEFQVSKERELLCSINRESAERLEICRISDRIKTESIECEDLLLDIEPSNSADSSVYLVTPLFMSDSKLPLWREKLTKLVAAGYTRFVVSTYGMIPVLREISHTLTLVAGHYLYCVNRWTLTSLLSSGIKMIVLPSDVDERELNPLNRSSLVVRVANIRTEYFVTRLRMPCKEYHYKGEKLKVLSMDEYDTLVIDK